jgi:tetratricopeptide (TPR) repeat protein
LSDHLTAGQAERFLRGELTRTQAKEVLRHLLKGCETCAGQLGPLLHLVLTVLSPERTREDAPVKASGSHYDAPIARALAGALSRQPQARKEEWTRVERGLDLLRSSPRGLAGLTDDEAKDLRGWPFVEVLLQLSFEERYRNPEKMLQLALLAKTAAENLDPEDYDAPLIADYQARAWAELGNAHRVNDELEEAAAALDIAEERLRQGTGNLLLLARAADLRASLLNTQRRLSDACELLGGVYELYRKVGDDHLAGRTLVSKGIYTNYEGNPQEALRILRQGLKLLDPERDPRLVTSATQSILEVMVQCGEFREAAVMLMESGLRLALAGEPLNLAKLRGVEGQIFAGLGKSARAEAAFLEARAGFLAHGQGYNAALVGLDLAAVWLERGQQAQVKELAADMLSTFQRLGIQREAVRALDYLNRVCHKQRATPRMVRHVKGFLKQLEREPQLRFQAV